MFGIEECIAVCRPMARLSNSTMGCSWTGCLWQNVKDGTLVCVFFFTFCLVLFYPPFHLSPCKVTVTLQLFCSCSRITELFNWGTTLYFMFVCSFIMGVGRRKIMIETLKQFFSSSFSCIMYGLWIWSSKNTSFVYDLIVIHDLQKAWPIHVLMCVRWWVCLSMLSTTQQVQWSTSVAHLTSL